MTVVDLNKHKYLARFVPRALLRYPASSLLLILFFLTSIFGCSDKDPIGTPPPVAPPMVSILPQVQNLADVEERDIIYTIGPYDKIRITIWRYGEFGGDKIVKDDGTIFMPQIGHIKLGGLTLQEARQLLADKLQEYVILDPQVDIEPVEVSSKLYTILGAVTRPGRYPIFQKTDVPMAIALAGGQTPGGGLDRAYLSRNGKTFIINIRTILTRGNVDLYLAKNDILYIPTVEDMRVFVLGYVTSPGAVSITGTGLDLISAISSAGGFRLGAKKKSVAVMRSGPEGLYAYRVNIKDALKLKVDPGLLNLQPGDIVYVPKTVLGSWNEVIQLISPTLNTLVYQPLGAGRDYYYIRNQINQ